jgi:hypothetical protein
MMLPIFRRRVLLVAGALVPVIAMLGAAQHRDARVPDAATPLPLSAVRLTGGPLKAAQDVDAKYLLELEPDRMLSYFRVRAGLPRKAEPYGGWDGGGRNLTGHIAGHYLSAVSLMWAATGDPRFKQRADYIVAELEEVQNAHGDGYLMAVEGAREVFAAVARGDIRSSGFDLNGLWVPWYTAHKLFAGLRDAHRHTGSAKALAISTRFATWADGVVSKLDDDQVQKMLNTEQGGMAEVLADLSVDTGDARWLALSRRFTHHAVVDPLAHQEDRLSGLHGNTNIPKLIGAAARYSYTGEPEARAASRFFWDRVVNHHSFVTGSHSKDEYFRDPDRIAAIADGRTAESCNVYNMLKLTRRLFAQQPDEAYAAFMERAIFNHALGSIDPSDGATCYMVPVGRAVSREYADMFESFTCCVGTGMENHALHGHGIYYETGDRLWVNLFVPSRVEWAAAGAAFEMATGFPEGEDATLTVTKAPARPVTLAIRRPAWATEGFTVRVNGAPVSDVPPPGAYVELRRAWSRGDAIQLALPKRLGLVRAPDDPRRAAIVWGPLALAGDLGPGRRRQPGDQGAVAHEDARVESPVLVTDKPVTDWVKPADRAGTLRTAGVGRDRDVDLVPFYRLHRRTYTTYWDLLTPAEFDARRADLAAERERQRRLDARTVAYIQPGEMQPERDFNMRGEDTSVVRTDGRPGRRGSKWFSFDVPVDETRPAALVVTYYRDSRRPRAFQVLVDGERVGQESLGVSSDAAFFDVEYAVPAEMVTGKTKVTVRFEAIDDREIAAVFGVRMMRATEGR